MAGPGTGFDYNDAPALRRGDRGVWVAFLKETMRYLGFDTDETDSFDEEFEETVRNLQQRLDVLDDGVVDRETWATMSSTLYLGDLRALPTEIARGATGGAVDFLQECLALASHYSDEPTGRYDRATHAAVVAFNRDNSIAADAVAPATWLSLGRWAVLHDVAVRHALGDAPDDDATHDADADADAEPLRAPSIRGVFFMSLEGAVAQVEVLVHNPNPQPMHYVRVEILQEDQYNDETLDVLAAGDAASITIAANAYTLDDGTIAAFGQVRVAWLDPTSGDWSEPVEQEFNVGVDADGDITATGTGETTGPHLTITGIDHDDEIEWLDDERGRLNVRITLHNDGGSPANDATLEVEEQVSGGGRMIIQQIDQRVLDVGDDHVVEMDIDVPRRHNDVPVRFKVLWAATAGHGSEHSIDHMFILRREDDGRVIGLEPY